MKITNITVDRSSVSTEINATIDFNFQSDKETVQKFELELENGSIYHGEIKCALHCNRILLIVKDSKNLKADLELNEVAYTNTLMPWKPCRKIIGPEANSLIESSIFGKCPPCFQFLLSLFQLKENLMLDILKGKFRVTFETTSTKMRKEKLIKMMGYFKLQQDGNGKDFEIVCKDKEFRFNKSALAKMHAEIDFNFQREEDEWLGCKKFEINFQNGSVYHGEIRCALNCNRIILYIKDSKIINVDLDLNEVVHTVYGPYRIPGVIYPRNLPIDSNLAVDEIKIRKIIGLEANSLIESTSGRFSNRVFQLKKSVEFNILKGKIKVTFEPTSEILHKEKMVNMAGHFQFQQDGNGEDVKIICEGKEFGFNKSILVKFSPVFDAMFENNQWLEFRKNSIKIEDATPETIEAFKNVLNNNQIEEDDLSVGLYMWAHRYDIMPLFKLCQDHLGATLCEEDLLEVLEVADLYDDKILLSKIAGKESLFRNRRFMLDEIFQSMSYF